MSATVKGIIDWDLKRDAEGHRDYTLKTLVETNDYDDGPASAFSAAGLPLAGSSWVYGNDNDFWAFCWPTASINRWQPKGGEKGRHWVVQNLFSTRPYRRCQDTTIENPLAEPPKISGSFVRYAKEVEKDRFNRTILSSSHEQITGLSKNVSRPSVTIEQNLASLNLPLVCEMVNGVNDFPMWGVGSRCVMLTDVSWSRNLYGVCTFYYTRRLEFEVKFDSYNLTDVADKGFRVRKGKWYPDVLASPTEFDWVPDGVDSSNPKNFIVYEDYKGNKFPTATLLNGNGDPLTDINNPVFLDPIQLEDQYNFFALGIPAFF